VISYKGFDHVALVTKRLPDMVKFYKEGLGLSIEHESVAKAGYKVVTLGAGAAILDLLEATPTNPAHSANLTETHFCLVAHGTSIYDVIANLKRAGLTPQPAEVTSGAEGKSLSTFLRDPDGNLVEIKVY
jgi:glyoxylase I family protein